MNYIGIDVHCKFCEVAVVDKEGKLLMRRSVKTGAKELIEAVLQVKGKRSVVIEESTLAGWVRRTLAPYADDFVVAEPKHNALIACSENKNDKTDAERLAQLMRGGFIHAVHHTDDMAHLEFKETVLHYHDSVNQVIRFKNKLKGLYRLHGMTEVGYKIYDREDGLESLKRLPFGSSRHRARSLLDLIRVAERSMEKAAVKLKSMKSRFPAIGLFEDIPGVGLIVSVTVVAIIETPHRFPTKRQVWKYANLAVAHSESGGKQYGCHASKEGNRLLKKVLMQAALSAGGTDTRFGRRYREIKQRKGACIAQRTIARSILSTMYTMWRTGECYREIP